MNKIKSVLVIGVFLLSIINVSACAPDLDPTQTYVTKETIQLPTIVSVNFPRLDGSTSTMPLTASIVCEIFEVPCHWFDGIDGFRYLVPELSDAEEIPSIAHHGTHDAYVNLIEKEADLIFVARRSSQDELELAAKAGVQLEVDPIALDAFVFILNEDNPVESLTISEIQDIYTGKITNWLEVGGEDAEIHPYQRNENSGSQELMRTLVMKELRMVDAPEMILPKMMAPIYAVSDDINGIGYSVYYFEQFMAPNELIKVIAVDGIQPTQETIKSLHYPFTTEVYLATRNDLPGESIANQLREWMLSPLGQVVIAESGYVPLY